MEKKQRQAKKMAVRIVALILALMMIIASVATLILYIIY